ncbi:hypothetical protein [Pelagerythrobacter rhizovicinus]|uniref:Oligosaccharide repeat unit polymerase n=1 Tax=Pelagerythrobacter rhizovicinus TaxID=2268576 RepID=A0A4Q2KK82_9SPHN|nr:hypothetical protein [Pelagerythrobacter rhizovicinus]RXZ64757.1 hypothetical protein ETX26_12895 [Pelagerythrobacter rhizovicinus]
MREGRSATRSAASNGPPHENILHATEGLARVARENTTKLIAVLFFQEAIWLGLNRIVNRGHTFYITSEFYTPMFLMLIALAGIYTFLGWVFSRGITSFPRIYVRPRAMTLTFLVAIVANVLAAGFLAEGARYNSGELTGVTGVIYAIARAASLMVMVLAIKGRYGRGSPANTFLLIAFVVSMAITIDGLAIALTISAFLCVLLRVKTSHDILLGILAFVLVGTAFYIGFWSKFSVIPAYLTPEFAFRWSISRMSISAESLYKYLSGESMFNDSMAYLDVIQRSYLNRYNVIMGEGFVPSFPRSVSEGFYMDMYRVPGAGSSPGFYLGILLHGLFSPLFLLAFTWMFMQLFYGIRTSFGYVRIFALSLILKVVHGNVTEYIIVLSPSIMIVVLFILACLIEVRDGKAR